MYLADSKSSKFVIKVCAGIRSLLQHQNYLATSDRVTLYFFFPLVVSGSAGDKFGFTNLRISSSKSEFYDIFRQDKCTTLDFKRISICLCLRSFDPRKTLINCLVSNTFHWIVQRSRERFNVDLPWKEKKFIYQTEFRCFGIIQYFKKVHSRRLFFWLVYTCTCICHLNVYPLELLA